MKQKPLCAALLVSATLLPGVIRAEEAVPNARPPRISVSVPHTPTCAHTITGSSANAIQAQIRAFAGSAATTLSELRDDIVRELLTTQLTLIGGHPTVPSFSPPPTPPVSPPTTQGGSPPPQGTPSPPPPPGGNNPPPPPPGGPPPGTPPPPPPPPSGGGTPPDSPPPGPPGPPVNDAPEPTSLVIALIGAGLASSAAWRRRSRRANETRIDETSRG